MKTAVPLPELVGYLDEYLRIKEIPDEANAVNGLQVESVGSVGSIVAAVDASQATIDGVVATLETGQPPPLLLVHHGLLWDGNVPLTGRRYRRVSALLDHDIPLYAAHIPLDVHPEVGNNAVLAEQLGCGLRAGSAVTADTMGVWGDPRPAYPRESRWRANSIECCTP